MKENIAKVVSQKEN